MSSVESEVVDEDGRGWIDGAIITCQAADDDQERC